MARNQAFTRNEIKTFFDQARRVVKDPGLTILAAPSQADLGRILVVTSRKIGNAPQRNKIRRRLKELFRNLKLAEHGYDYAIIVRYGGIDFDFEKLKELLKKAFSKIERSNNATINDH